MKPQTSRIMTNDSAHTKKEYCLEHTHLNLYARVLQTLQRQHCQIPSFLFQGSLSPTRILHLLLVDSHINNTKVYWYIYLHIRVGSYPSIYLSLHGMLFLSY